MIEEHLVLKIIFFPGACDNESGNPLLSSYKQYVELVGGQQ